MGHNDLVALYVYYWTRLEQLLITHGSEYTAVGCTVSDTEWWQALTCVWVGYGIAAPFIVANFRPESIFHVMFLRGYPRLIWAACGVSLSGAMAW